MTHNDQITNEEDKKFKLEKFRFQLNEEKKAMIFGQTGMLQGSEFTLQPKATFLKADYWHFEQPFMTGIYDKGLLLFSMVGGFGITSVRATCDNFK